MFVWSLRLDGGRKFTASDLLGKHDGTTAGSNQALPSARAARPTTETKVNGRCRPKIAEMVRSSTR